MVEVTGIPGLDSISATKSVSPQTKSPAWHPVTDLSGLCAKNAAVHDAESPHSGGAGAGEVLWPSLQAALVNVLSPSVPAAIPPTLGGKV